MQLLVTWLWKLSKAVNILTAVPLVLAGAAMVIVVLAGTYYRYVLNAPLIWSEEAARYLMIWIGLAGAAVAMRHGDHIAIGAVRDRMPGPLRTLGDLIVAVAIGWFLWVLVSEGWQAAQRGSRQASPALGISMFWPLMSVPVAGILLIVQHILHTVLRFLGVDTTDDKDALPGGGAF